MAITSAQKTVKFSKDEVLHKLKNYFKNQDELEFKSTPNSNLFKNQYKN